MTAATVDLTREFIAALQPHARGQLHITQTVSGMVHAAVRDHGWPVRLLAAECSRDLDGVINAGAVITHRLRHAAGNPPPTAPAATGLPVIPLCGECEDGFLLDPESLLPVARCPCRTTTKETV